MMKARALTKFEHHEASFPISPQEFKTLSWSASARFRFFLMTYGCVTWRSSRVVVPHVLDGGKAK